MTFFSAQIQTRKIFIGTKKLITEILEKNISHFTHDALYLLRFCSCSNNRAEGMRQKYYAKRMSLECVLPQQNPDGRWAVLHSGQAADTVLISI
jgi:hypothetical protein